MIKSATITATAYPQRVEVLTADIEANDTAPSPHDVETEVERDASGERAGVYELRAKVASFGPLSAEPRQALHRAIAACPIHKLMTTSDVQIEQIET